MSEQIESPFGGGGSQNLKPEQLQQAWSLQMVLKYQEKVRELSALLRQEEMERNQ